MASSREYEVAPHATGIRIARAVAVLVLIVVALVVALIYVNSRRPVPAADSQPTAPGPTRLANPSAAHTIPATPPPVTSNTLRTGQLYQLLSAIPFYRVRPDAKNNTNGEVYFTLPTNGYFLCAGIEKEQPAGNTWYRARAWDAYGTEYIGWLDGRVVTVSSTKPVDWSTDPTAPAPPDESVEQPETPASRLGPRTAETTPVYVTDSGTTYHRAGCRQLDATRRQTTLADVQVRGLEPCSACRPPEPTPTAP